MSLSYGWEKLHLAVDGAATSDSTLQDRLADAYVYHIIHVAPENVTPEIWQRIKTLAGVLTSATAKGNEGTVKATTSLMDDLEATKWLHEIVSLYDSICEAYYVSLK